MTSLRRSRTARVAGGLAVAGLFGAFGTYQLARGALPGLHAQFTATLLAIADSGHWAQLLYQYPFLPLFLVAAYPSMKTLLAVGALTVGGLTVGLWARQPDRLLAVGTAAVFVSPLGAELATAHVAGAIGLLFLSFSFFRFRSFLQTGDYNDLFYLAIHLGVASYATPLALPTGVAMWIFFLAARPRPLLESLAIGAALLLPVVVSVGGWVYTEWALTPSAEWPAYDFAASPLTVGPTVLAAPLYLIVLGGRLLSNPGREDLVLLIPLFPLLVVGYFGQVAARAAGVGLLVVGGVTLVPSKRALRQPVLVAALLIQTLVAWYAFWPPGPGEQSRAQIQMEQAIARTVSRADSNDVLTDPNLTARIMVRVGTGAPFLTSFHNSYYLATLTPGPFVDYILIGPRAPNTFSDLAQKYVAQSPRGFRPVWQWRTYRLDRERGATPLRAALPAFRDR